MAIKPDIRSTPHIELGLLAQNKGVNLVHNVKRGMKSTEDTFILWNLRKEDPRRICHSMYTALRKAIRSLSSP